MFYGTQTISGETVTSGKQLCLQDAVNGFLGYLHTGRCCFHGGLSRDPFLSADPSDHTKTWNVMN